MLLLYSKHMNVFLAILALGLLIVVHEAGHLVVARLCGMRVERFSIGFGPAILKWQHKGTQFQLAPIPFGGFVQITGMNPHEEFDEKDPAVYPNRPALLRFLTIFAGPATNVLFSSVLIFIVILGAGVMSGNKVNAVSAGSAAEGVLLPGDLIVEVAGTPVEFGGVTAEVQKSAGRPLDVTVLRGGTPTHVTITPKRSEAGVWLLGIELTPERRRPVGLGTAVWQSLQYPVETSGKILTGLYMAVRGDAEVELTGPVGITDAISKSIKAGWMSGLEFLAMLNVMLGLFNLLPLPALDGGRLVFLSYELATRRRPNPKIEAAVHMVGFVFLLVVMVLVLFKDIKRVVG